LAATRRAKVTRLKAELAQAYQEIALLREEMEIKNARLQRISPHRRPHYSSIQRMRILNLRAARRWSVAQTARALQVTTLTIITWTRLLDEQGENALLQLAEPVNKFPDFVRAIVRHVQVLFPGLGKEKIAQILARAELHLGVSTVSRMAKDEGSLFSGPDAIARSRLWLAFGQSQPTGPRSIRR
jgi:hypothetical protein